jgi:tetratricopeptide (TPR) repeat protein
MNQNTTVEKLIKLYNEKQKPLTIAFAAIISIIGLIYYTVVIYLPEQEETAQSDMYMAQFQFDQGNYELALKGEGKNKGFDYIKDNYSFTNAKKIAKLYAGICKLNLGQYDKAIEDLKGYSTDVTEMQAVAYSSLAGAYSEKKNMKEALEYYEKAANATKNPALAPKLILLAGKAFMSQKNNEKALEMFDKIETDFPNSQEAQMAQIYRTGAEATASK